MFADLSCGAQSLVKQAEKFVIFAPFRVLQLISREAFEVE
jgi:hypothetical protein